MKIIEIKKPKPIPPPPDSVVVELTSEEVYLIARLAFCFESGNWDGSKLGERCSSGVSNGTLYGGSLISKPFSDLCSKMGMDVRL